MAQMRLSREGGDRAVAWLRDHGQQSATNCPRKDLLNLINFKAHL